MARIRSIKPETFLSESLSDLPLTAMVTFIGMWTQADDEGRLKNSPRILNALLWGTRPEHTVKHMGDDIAALATGGSGVLCDYEVDGQSYLHIVNWKKHQKINRPSPSSLPACPKCDIDSGFERLGKAEPRRTRDNPTLFQADAENLDTNNSFKTVKNRSSNTPQTPLNGETSEMIDDLFSAAAASRDALKQSRKQAPKTGAIAPENGSQKAGENRDVAGRNRGQLGANLGATESTKKAPETPPKISDKTDITGRFGHENVGSIENSLGSQKVASSEATEAGLRVPDQQVSTTHGALTEHSVSAHAPLREGSNSPFSTVRTTGQLSNTGRVSRTSDQNSRPTKNIAAEANNSNTIDSNEYNDVSDSVSPHGVLSEDSRWKGKERKGKERKADRPEGPITMARAPSSRVKGKSDHFREPKPNQTKPRKTTSPDTPNSNEKSPETNPQTALSKPEGGITMVNQTSSDQTPLFSFEETTQPQLETATRSGETSEPARAEKTAVAPKRRDSTRKTAASSEKEASETAAPKKRRNPKATAERVEVAKRILDPWWVEYGKGWTQSYIVVRSVIVSILANNVPEDDIARAMDKLGRERKPISGGTVGFALSKMAPRQSTANMTSKQNYRDPNVYRVEL